MEEYSKALMQTVSNFLTKDEWHFTTDEEHGLIRCGVNLDSKLREARYLVIFRKDSFTVYATSSISADCKDSQQMAAMAEFLTRANYGLKNGNFEMDFDDGEIRYKSFVDCDGALPSDEIIHSSMIVPAMMIDHYADGILGIIFMGMDAKSAIDKIEN